MSKCTVPKMMEVFAIDAVQAAQSSHGVELDYSAKSVGALDEILDRAHRTLRLDDPEDMVFAFPEMWGGYLGEVIRRQWGGQWLVPTDGPLSGQISLAVRGEVISPPAQVLKRVRDGDMASLCVYLAELERTFSSRPE
jgi:hypothetical protein